MNFAPRILLIICLAMGGFLFPLLWLGAVILSFTVYADSRPQRRSELDGRFPIITKDDGDWLQKVRACTESPAEIAFLDAMVSSFNLLPQDRTLRGEDIVLRMQVEVPPYRLDFLVDETLVVEIDGAEWHSSDEAIARDAKRDAVLIERGYTILRIPAKIALFKPKEAIQMVCQKRPEAAERHAADSRQRAEALRAGLNPLNLLSAASEKWSAVASMAEEGARLAEEYRERQIALEHDPEEIAKLKSRQAELIREISVQFKPDPDACMEIFKQGYTEAGLIKEYLAKQSPPHTVSKEKACLASIENFRRRLERLKETDAELKTDDRRRKIYEMLDQEPEKFSVAMLLQRSNLRDT